MRRVEPKDPVIPLRARENPCIGTFGKISRKDLKIWRLAIMEKAMPKCKAGLARRGSQSAFTPGAFGLVQIGGAQAKKS
jgi:hypothetical protein